MTDETKKLLASFQHGVELHDDHLRAKLPAEWLPVLALVRQKLLSFEATGGGWRRYALTLSGRAILESTL